ncbi:MAG: MipA/OmpV family protein [Alphaproteobacteria bacterium]|nr:MipA/OmpV family protein [Alphaproteobacteria bacterium]
MTMRKYTRRSKLYGAAGLVVISLSVAALAAPAYAQQDIDEPQLSPMLFGETEKERREKIRQEQEAQDEALLISDEQERDHQDLDEPRLDPLVFGPRWRDDEDEDLTGSLISLGPEDNNRGFFSAFNFLTPEETNLSFGLGPVYRPDYFGSDDYKFRPDPQVYIKVKNFVFLDDAGADIALFGFSRFRAGPTMRIVRRRDQDDNPDLFGLGDVGTTFEFGGFAATTFLDRFAVKAKVRHGLKTGHRGTIVDGVLTALIFRSDLFSLSTTARASWVGNRYADAYFSVTPAQSARSGGRLPVYDANAGFRDIGVSVTGYVNIGDRWSFNPYATYSYVYGEIAKTPIIAQYGNRDQFTVGVHLMRQFNFNTK